MGDKNLTAGLNEQLGYELYSAYLYFELSAGLERLGLSGAASWMKKQAAEELTHADAFFRYLVDHRLPVELAEIPRPGQKFDSLDGAFKLALKHEKSVTTRLERLAGMACEERNIVAADFLRHWLVEQSEEELQVQRIIDRLTLAADSRAGRLFIDAELGKR